jgi:polyhydroxybutyrate depolymerase
VKAGSGSSRTVDTVLPALVAGLALLIIATGSLFATGTAARAYSPEIRQVGLEVDGRQRSYLLQPAQGLAPGSASALVVVLHQEGGTPRGVAAETALSGLRQQGVTLAYPAGVDRSWAAGACCGTPRDLGIDDVAFLDAVLVDVAEQVPVDRSRTAFVGYSSGGMLTYRFVCERPGALAVAIVVSGSLESSCADDIRTPDLLALHGKADGTVGFDQPKFIPALGMAPQPVVRSLDLLTRSAGCAAAPTTTRLADTEVRQWNGCRGGEVHAQLVDEVGHGWGPLEASRRTLEFLLTHLIER